MITNFILAPIIIHFLTAIVLLFFWQKVRAQKIISIIGNIMAFFACVLLFIEAQDHMLVLYSGGWDAPFGITFVADSLSSIMVLLTAIVSLAVGIYSTVALNIGRIK